MHRSDLSEIEYQTQLITTRMVTRRLSETLTFTSSSLSLDAYPILTVVALTNTGKDLTRGKDSREAQPDPEIPRYKI
jgi:hypothetical protein